MGYYYIYDKQGPLLSSHSICRRQMLLNTRACPKQNVLASSKHQCFRLAVSLHQPIKRIVPHRADFIFKEKWRWPRPAYHHQERISFFQPEQSATSLAPNSISQESVRVEARPFPTTQTAYYDPLISERLHSAMFDWSKFRNEFLGWWIHLPAGVCLKKIWRT